MFQALRASTILLVCVHGFAALAADAPNPLGLGIRNAIDDLRVTEITDCKAEEKSIALELADPKKSETEKADLRSQLEKQKLECLRLKAEAKKECTDEKKAASDALKDLGKACHAAGMANLGTCSARVASKAKDCLALDLSTRRTSTSQARRLYETYESSSSSSSSRGRADQCITMGSSEYLKQKADYEKNAAQIETDINKANQTIAERRQSLQDRVSKIKEKQNEAEREFRTSSDRSAKSAQDDAVSLSRQMSQLEGEKAKATSEKYEPKMNETKNRAEELVALKKFSDIRGICMAEYRENLARHASLYRNSSDQFRASTEAKADREKAYWDCVSTYQAQVVAIKRSHAQARQAYRDQAHSIEQRINDIDQSKRMAQRQQAESQQRVAASNQELGRLLRERMESMKAETETVQKAEARAEEDHKKLIADMEKRSKDIYTSIDALGARPLGEKTLSEAGAAIEALVDARNALKANKSIICQQTLVGLEATAKSRGLKFDKLEVDSERTGNSRSSSVGEVIRVNQGPITAGGREEDVD